jgi:CubicO group peptidase (beta-lactamase class C family)
MRIRHPRRFLAVSAIVWICAVAGVGRSRAMEPGGPLRVDEEAAKAYDLSEVRGLLHGAVEAGRVPGASLILVYRGTVIFKEASGVADIESGKPFTVDSLCHLASATKWMSGATMMAMVDDGKISLEDPIGKYLPAYMDIPIKGSREEGNPTIRQCFSGTSGMPGPPGDLAMKRALPLLESVAWIRSQFTELGWAPGSGTGHISVGMQIVGGIVEKVAGKPFETYMRAKILDPVGMPDTTFNPQPKVFDRIPTVYAAQEGGGLQVILGVPDGNIVGADIGGGLYSTLDDYARFLQMHLDGGRVGDTRVLSPEAVREMLSDQTGGVPQKRRSPYGDMKGYAFGAAILEVDEEGNPLLLGDGGAFGTFAWIDLEADLVGVYLTQMRITSHYDLFVEGIPEAARTAVEGRR